MASLLLLTLSALSVGALASFQSSDRGPAIVGAIRWDAYFATPGTPVSVWHAISQNFLDSVFLWPHSTVVLSYKPCTGV